jgi:membrane protease YdiL (CAAX protease family)
MVNGGSGPRARLFDAVLAFVSTLLGILAMVGTIALTARLWLGGHIRLVLLLSEAALVVPALVLLSWRRSPSASSLGLRWESSRVIGLAVGVGAALWLASLGLLELQFALWAPPAGYLEGFRRLHELLRPANPADALVSLLAIAIAPAVCEEIVIRGVLLPALVPVLRVAPAVIASSLVFALMHDAYRMPFTFAVGLVLGALRLRAGSLTPTILAHASLNALTFLAAPYFDNPLEPLPDPRPLLGAGLLVVGVMIAASLWRRWPPSLTAREPAPRLQP